MRILITGGLGYIGGRLALYLQDLYPNAEIHLTTTRMQYPQWCESFHIHTIDITQSSEVMRVIKKIQPESIIHLAGLPQKACEARPDLAQKTNIEATRDLLNFAKEYSVKKFVYFSTFQIYGSGDSLEGIIDELKIPMPVNVYGQTKLLAEQVVMDDLYTGIDRYVIRLSNAFGAPADIQVASDIWKLVFNAFALKTIQKDIIAPKANVCRDYIMMTDVIRGVDHILHLSKQSSGIYNLGGDNTMTVNQVAEVVSELALQLLNYKINIHPAPEKNTTEFKYSIDKIRKTGFSLKGDMKHEIKDLFDICKIKLNR